MHIQWTGSLRGLLAALVALFLLGCEEAADTGKTAEAPAEVGVIVALMGAGLKLDRPVGWRRWSSTWRLLAITMPLSILAVAVLGWWVAGLAPAAALLRHELKRRFHEALAVYGPTIKELIHEEFGDGIMSAINFKLDVSRRADPGGDRVVVTFDGKFLDYQW